MSVNPLTISTFALLLATGLPTAAEAQIQAAQNNGSDLGFLEVGRSYSIQFPEDRHPVRVKESGVQAQPNGPPATWRANFQVNVFVVRKRGGGSWALLEHPSDPKAAVDILSARSLLADKAKLAEIEADPSRKDFLTRRREAAKAELQTTRTWANLAHALSISDPPAEERWEMKIKSIEVK